MAELNRDRSDSVRRQVAVNARRTDLLIPGGSWITAGGRTTHGTVGTSRPTRSRSAGRHRTGHST